MPEWKPPTQAEVEQYSARLNNWGRWGDEDQRGTLIRALFDDLKKQAGAEVLLAEPKKPKKEVEAKGPARGPEGAKVTIVEFSDFQCPFCSRQLQSRRRLCGHGLSRLRCDPHGCPLSCGVSGQAV